MRTTRMFILGLFAGGIALLTIAASRVGEKQSSPAKAGSHGANPRLEGSWLVEAAVTGDPSEIHALLTCTPSGEVVETPSVPLAVSTGHGAWIRTGKNEFAITVVYLRRGGVGEFLGTSRVRSVFLINEAMTQGEGRFETQVFDVAGQMVGSFDGIASATRILAEPLSLTVDAGNLGRPA